MFALALAQQHAPLGDLVLQIGFSLTHALAQIGHLFPLRDKVRLLDSGGLTNIGKQFRMTFGALLASIALAFLVADFSSKLLQPVTALLGNRTLEAIGFRSLLIALLDTPLLQRGNACMIFGEQLQPPIQQA